MIKLVRQRLVMNTIQKRLMNGKSIRCASSKDDRLSPLCPDTQQPPCCRQETEPPPCPPPPPPCGPPCPPPFCSVIPDPNNPCNYVPPEYPDPDEPNMTRIKRLQCLYQKDEEIPVYLQGSRYNVYFFHIVTILGGITFIQSIYSLYLLINK